jgi:hypothetical protein
MADIAERDWALRETIREVEDKLAMIVSLGERHKDRGRWPAGGFHDVVDRLARESLALIREGLT